MKTKKKELDFEIDKLTNSIENAISGEVFETVISQINGSKQIKKADWLFDWHSEIKSKTKNVFKLTTLNNSDIIHGIISFTDKGDHVFMDLIESAKFNKGNKKLYHGVAGNLVAFACKTSFEKGYDGIVSFIAKTQLIEHYKLTLGAKLFSGNRMFIDTKEAYILTIKYFKNFKL
ncbi:MAG TPA: hypothetical protein PLJ42_12335 [Chitinophagales bacterium]|nr:hypothetical protein [Chitinophagales bacterium]MBP6153995.1 hypothetical protein [Chitinophagales bacterium]HQV79320.1 hypothetical protein [Chitinophagales bacterium]HQW80212.1 hypothetical protein [Chitinophagales bacterium]